MISEETNKNLIELSNAEIHQQDFQVLNDVCFSLEPGEFVYLIGKVGSGKSSILKTLYADIPLKKGTGQVAGHDLSKIGHRTIPYLRRKIGIVFQDFQLLTDRKVFDNLSFVLKATKWKDKNLIDKRIDEVLDLVELKDKKFRMPHELSGGEQQRVVIARALLNDPKIILADEPTGNLDPETSEGIMKLLFRIKDNGKAIVMATHNYTLLKKFPAKTYRCFDGRFTEVTEFNDTIDFDML